MLKEITINRLVLAKLFANAKPLHEGCVLRATVWCSGKRKDFWVWWNQVKIPTLQLTSCQEPQTSYVSYKPQFLYLQNGKTKQNHLSLTAIVRIRWASVCKVLDVPGTKQALKCQFPLHQQNLLQLLLDIRNGNALDRQAPHDIPPEILQLSSVFLFPVPSPSILHHLSCHEQVWPHTIIPCYLTSSNKSLHPTELKSKAS